MNVIIYPFWVVDLSCRLKMRLEERNRQNSMADEPVSKKPRVEGEWGPVGQVT